MMKTRKKKFPKRKKKRNTIDLPEDLVVEILSRVPEASLAPFRSISKGWNALIKKEERLAKKSRILMLIDFRVYLASVDLPGSHENVVKLTTSEFSLKDPLSNSSKEVDIRNVFHCDGLLLCTTTDKRLVVWNPRSGETSWVKPRISHEESDIYALGKSSCNKYKILRINTFPYIPTCLVEYEVYDFNTNSWRVTVGENRGWYILAGRPLCGMSVSGNTYWLAHASSFDEFLLSFDFSTERFGRVSLPPGNYVSYRVWGLSVTREEQQLCLLTTQSTVVFDIIDLWRATKIKSSGAVSWSKFLSVDLAYLHHPFGLGYGTNFLADRENKILVLPGIHGNLYIVGEDKYIKVDNHDQPTSARSLLYNYVPTLAQIQ
ncbi:unnamed protein product [Microthlaspi erraticum]|uniref:F-box domain-containing protein n=1 Tax=Microthlaspi erraticum TaxID=1685480 RepID=A0A6D2HBL9_9BRAS|nr:unnamed protein product [Microthlaspi erraticum]